MLVYMELDYRLFGQTEQSDAFCCSELDSMRFELKEAPLLLVLSVMKGTF